MGVLNLFSFHVLHIRAAAQLNDCPIDTLAPVTSDAAAYVLESDGSFFKQNVAGGEYL
jgi:hypothetical protein